LNRQLSEGEGMTGIRRKYVSTLIHAALIAVFATSTAFSRPPNDLQDLVGARANDQTLRSRGYQPSGGNFNGGANWVYWWNSGTRVCAGIVTANGRYDRIDQLDPGRCGNRPGYPGGGYPPGGNYGPVPRIRVDTSGKGNFNGLGMNFRVTRGWVDTISGRPMVALSGERNSRVNFYGRVQGGGRDFTMRIEGTDGGDANGTISFRLNGDRNEVETISVNGRSRRGPFNGFFSR
jgi:hypothetical protein